MAMTTTRSKRTIVLEILEGYERCSGCGAIGERRIYSLVRDHVTQALEVNAWQPPDGWEVLRVPGIEDKIAVCVDCTPKFRESVMALFPLLLLPAEQPK